MKLAQFACILLAVCLPFLVSAQTNHKRHKRSNGFRFSLKDAQQDSLEDRVDAQGFAYFACGFQSDVNDLGRDNNVRQFGLTPSLGFQKNNFDVYCNGFRWSQTTPHWAETDLGISKLWNLTKAIALSAVYEHSFIDFGSADDRFGLNNLASLQLGWTNPLFEINARYDCQFGTARAATLEFILGREWDFYDVFVRDKVEVEPRLYLDFLNGTAANWELELPITWRKIGDWECGATFNYALPQHVLLEEGSGRPFFYFTLNAVKVFPVAAKHGVERSWF